MNLDIAKEVAALRRLSIQELRAKHGEVFGDDSLPRRMAHTHDRTEK